MTEDHGAFCLKSESGAVAEFLVLLDVGCKRPRVTVDKSAYQRRVRVVGQAFVFD